jgi:hypothetical protein
MPGRKILSTTEKCDDMTTINKQVETETKTQSDFWFLYRAVNIAAFGFICILSANDHNAVAFLLLAIQIVVNIVVVPNKIDELAERLKHVTFKTQLLNLYVTTLNPEQTDEFVTATFERTIEYLRAVGNTHGVKVHLMMFHDVNIFTRWIDPNGRVQSKVTPRSEGCTWQSFEQYLIDVDEFKRVDHEQRLRELRKDNISFNWFNQNVFEQIPGK